MDIGTCFSGHSDRFTLTHTGEELFLASHDFVRQPVYCHVTVSIFAHFEISLSAVQEIIHAFVVYLKKGNCYLSPPVREIYLVVVGRWHRSYTFWGYKVVQAFEEGFGSQHNQSWEFVCAADRVRLTRACLTVSEDGHVVAFERIENHWLNVFVENAVCRDFGLEYSVEVELLAASSIS